MNLDIRTLFVLTLVNGLLMGLAQLVIWTTRRADRSLLLWTVSNFVGAAGSLAVALRDIVPDWISIALGNALIIAWLLMLWAGTRHFDHRVLPASGIVGGTLAVFIAMMLPPLADNLAARAALIGALNGALLTAVTVELWRAQKQEPLTVRRFLIWVFVISAIACSLRAVFSMGLAPDGDFMSAGTIQAAMLLHMNLFILAWNLGGLLMTHERMQNALSRAASTDALTGLLNHAEFLVRAERRLARARIENLDVAMLMIGVRHLPAYNTLLSTSVVDDSVRRIAAGISTHTRPDDLLCRIGGEQFALLLPGCDLQAGLEVAQRICDGIDTLAVPHAGTPKGIATPIIGVSAGKAIDFVSARALAETADAALLHARQSHDQRISRFTAPKRYAYRASPVAPDAPA